MKETKDSSQRLNKAEKSWILYDVANSAFIMIVTATIPIYFRSLAEGSGMSGTSATSLWGSATSISILILALLSPVLGAIADYENFHDLFRHRHRRRLPFHIRTRVAVLFDFLYHIQDRLCRLQHFL